MRVGEHGCAMVEHAFGFRFRASGPVAWIWRSDKLFALRLQGAAFSVSPGNTFLTESSVPSVPLKDPHKALESFC